MLKQEVHSALVRLKAYLESRSAEVGLVYLPSGQHGEKVGLDDFLAAGQGKDDLFTLATSEVRSPEREIEPQPEPVIGTGSVGTVRTELEHCVATFQRWLHMPEPGVLLVTLASVVANKMEGDPLWLLIVGPPSGGKTETLTPLAGLPEVRMAATLTAAALLSGVPQRDVEAGAKGGLLREIGSFGYLVLKDFGSVLTMQKDAQAEVLAALREIYDGNWTRHVVLVAVGLFTGQASLGSWPAARPPSTDGMP